MKEIGATLIFFAVTLLLFSQLVASHNPGEPLIQQVGEELSGILHGR